MYSMPFGRSGDCVVEKFMYPLTRKGVIGYFEMASVALTLKRHRGANSDDVSMATNGAKTDCLSSAAEAVAPLIKKSVINSGSAIRQFQRLHVLNRCIEIVSLSYAYG